MPQLIPNPMRNPETREEMRGAIVELLSDTTCPFDVSLYSGITNTATVTLKLDGETISDLITLMCKRSIQLDDDEIKENPNA